jgi:hypothetical protein
MLKGTFYILWVKYEPVNMTRVRGVECDDKGHIINANKLPSGAIR